MAADERLTYRVFGTPGSDNLVVLIGTGIGVALDPQPTETAAHDICVLAVALGDAMMQDPGGYGSETPAEQTAEWLVTLIRRTLEAAQSGAVGDRTPAGLVAYGDAADVALRAAGELGGTIERLALVAVAAPEQPLDRDDLGVLIAGVRAEVLIMNGEGDPNADAAAANWYQSHLPSARVEVMPRGAALSLASVWDRVLAHVAPNTKR